MLAKDVFLMEEFTTIWLKQHYSRTNHVEIAQMNCSLNSSINAAILKVFCGMYLEKQTKLEIDAVCPVYFKSFLKSSSTS